MRNRRAQKVGFIASCFDLGPHAGHLAALEEAAALCDYLVVGLHVDPSSERATKNKPVEPVSERYLKAMAVRFVDEVIPYETEAELVNLLKVLRPNIRFIGDDYKGKTFTGKELSIEIHYCSRTHDVSSSGLRQKIHEASKKKEQPK